MDVIWLTLAGFILLAYTLEAITGFGSIVIALSLGALFLPIDQLLPVLVPLNICMTGYLVWRHRQMIDRGLLLSMILPGMVVGTLIGYALLPWLDAALAKRLFGALVLWFAARELWRLRHAAAQPVRPMWLNRLLSLCAGISHGLFASGGPLLVFALAGTQLDKARLRATLVTVWFSLNSLLTVAFLLDGRLLPALPQVASYAPLLLIGVWLGERLHRRFNEQHFRIVIYGLLLGTGALLVTA
ncbi:sulfite exporter TauE/SafE family protein [Pseudomonas sp.]|uniref:sulfite exporter TauE/SafE family protein n=1 Tax=Pseudomonas sp. TaxID=306 RepID=UPI002CF1F858|nr:sulfite exporter TauE/SafE family protein [Pseudomonas sp.]HUE94587.1 sulfite exporter TauE/SafE family protein [Pseudomonas sp.]